jgi:hypothetical protein
MSMRTVPVGLSRKDIFREFKLPTEILNLVVAYYDTFRTARC